ncbi:MAG: hypothetical protein IMW89_21040 [Ktedonobacteraceae bacterium]|nr:hypothetical protein [Ktedonobacteraceae bacterium]
MPNRYEREIEEILRSLEQNEPRPSFGQKLSGRLHRKAGSHMSHSRRFTSLQLSLTEWLLIVAVAAALIGGGWAYLLEKGDSSAVMLAIASVVCVALATVSIVCILLVALSDFLFRPRSPRPLRYGNVTITPLRRNPLSNLKTRWNLFLLRMRYRRKNKE